MRLSMMIDLDRCVGCQACVTSCKQQWGSGPGAARPWVHEFERGTREGGLGLTFYPGLCMQCAEHPCTTDCPTGATYLDANGVVVVDSHLCIGCGNCISRCVYDARRADPVKGIVEKCNLCEPYVLRGEKPACVQTCLADCRIFGDLDEPDGEIRRAIAARDARPLVTAEIDVGPTVTFAGAVHREAILAQNVLRAPEESALTRRYGLARPLARFGLPLAWATALLGGLAVNLVGRRRAVQAAEAEAELPGKPATLPRHVTGLRVLHWFNAFSFVLLTLTGIGLMSADRFALFGTDFPRWLGERFGGAAGLLRFHVAWGLLWALVIVPGFLVYKKGGLHALQEIRLTRDDLRWLMKKPLALLGRATLPPQDKYNGGQKLFAQAVLALTATIIGTGLVMAFHLGSPALVSVAILVHLVAVVLVLMALAVHFTMAAVMKDERPALKSMITGQIDRRHAEHHSEKWVREHERNGGE